MTSLSYILKEMATGALSFLLMFSIIGLAYYPSPTVERAHGAATGSIVHDPIQTIQSTISAVQDTISAAASFALRFKELILDPIAWSVANIVIQRMTKDIVSWINSGFKGQPAFMRDFGGFLTNIADVAVGEFIAGDETLRFLCSPFQLDVRYALSLQYAKSRNYGSPNSSCTLTGITANLENFFDGNAIAGGWDQWFKVTQDPQYNPYGALLTAQEQMSVRISNTKGQQAQMLSWGKGFLSSQECTVVENRNVCRTTTPGTTIEEALNDALGSPSRRIAAADEINEILVALFTQLVNTAFSGAGGLLGLTGGGGGSSGPTYFTTLDIETAKANTTSASRETLASAISNETTYRSLTQSIITDIQDAANYKTDTYGTNYCHSGALNTELKDALATAQKEVTSATNNITTLTLLLARYDAAETEPNKLDLQNAVLQEFLKLQASGVLHMEPDITSLQQVYMPQVDDMIADFKNEIDTACKPYVYEGGA